MNSICIYGMTNYQPNFQSKNLRPVVNKTLKSPKIIPASEIRLEDLPQLVDLVVPLRIGKAPGFSPLIDGFVASHIRRFVEYLEGWVKNHPDDISTRAVLTKVNKFSYKSTDHGRYTDAVNKYIAEHNSFRNTKITDLSKQKHIGKAPGFGPVIDDFEAVYQRRYAEYLEGWVKDHPDDIPARAELTEVNKFLGKSTDHGEYTEAVNNYLKEHNPFRSAEITDLSSLKPIGPIDRGYGPIIETDDFETVCRRCYAEYFEDWVKDHPDDISARAELTKVNKILGKSTDHGEYTEAVNNYLKEHNPFRNAEITDLSKLKPIGNKDDAISI